MTTASEIHAQGLLHFAAGRHKDALADFRSALRESDSGELWNDWAAVQFILGHPDEAEAGFRCALDADGSNTLAALNLAALLLANNHGDEAATVLELHANKFKSAETQTAELLLQKARATANSEPSAALIKDELQRFVTADPNEQSYFQTHLQRYIETVRLLPHATPGAKLLELGAAFHHLTPALLTLKGFAEVRCNDIWSGSPQVLRELRSTDERDLVSAWVDNFDIQQSPWPYQDAAFDAVLFCEMLEHLHSDPLAVLVEINRVLRQDGVLLLTTPNLASCHSVEFALRGESPYVYGKFEPGGSSTDRHNREYTPREIQRLACAAGFETVRLETHHSWWQPDRQVLRLLASRAEPVALRGDNIFLLARKVATVRDRYPEEFYLRLGTQAERRVAQGGEHPSSPLLSAKPVSTLKILVIHELVPHFDQSGSDLRLLDVLKEFRAQGHRVTLLARDGADSDRYSPELESLGIRVIAGDPDRQKHLGADDKTSWSFNELLRFEQFDAAILCHWFWSGISVPEHYLSEIRRCSPNTRIAILTDDRHGERERRAATLSGCFSDFERANDFEAREVAAYRAADLVLYITEADRAHLAKFVPDSPMEHLPIVAQHSRDNGPGFDQRSGILFLGNFKNLANLDALDWLLNEIWPLVQRQRSDLTLFIAGHGCPTDLAGRGTSIITLGKVPDLAETFRSRLALVAPIRVGTGINTKNLQALAHGLPVVTTSIGAEGLRLVNAQTALVADTPREFAANILNVCSNVDLWQTLAKNGKSLIAEEFSSQRLADRVRQIVAAFTTLPANKKVSEELLSYREVESANPEVLSIRPANYRLVLRTLAYWQLGAARLASYQPAAALRQFRHIFTCVRGALPDTLFHRRLLADMAAAYRALNQAAAARRCEIEVNKLVLLRKNAASHSPKIPAKSVHGKIGSPGISVVIPTFNRKRVLSLSLAALAFQTLPSMQWEVIVVDDGSTDGTAEFLNGAKFPFGLTVLSQPNQGAGAARRAGVAAARGDLVLLCNDDTIASSTLLEEHLRLHALHSRSKFAILGQFYPSAGCGRRALSFWINHSPFLFPQLTLKPGQLCDSALFVTCNLSIRRQAILDAGNFDPAFRVGEDTELGARLAQLGYRVRFEPSAAATHEHSEFTSADLLRRAELYGAATWRLLQTHPQLLGNGSGPFGKLLESDFQRIGHIRAEKAAAAESGLAALRALDDFDISPLWSAGADGIRPVDAIIEKVGAIVPIVYWHFLFEHFLAAASSPAPALALAHSALSELAVP